MTSRLMARLFIVPLLIVLMIVGSSVVVVLLFGWITTSREESVEKLLDRIEAGAGDKIMSVALLPRDKEVWQAAMELASRLQSDDPRTLPPEKRPEIAVRIEALLDRTRGVEQTTMGQEMQQFLLTALGHLKQPTSVEVLAKYATDEKQPIAVRRHALDGLVLMRELPAARSALPELLPLIDSAESTLRVAGTAAIGALAQPGDSVALSGLTAAYRSNDREVVWNATLALARLRSKVCVPTLKDMLSRGYWESIKLDSATPTKSGQGDLNLTAVQVDGYLMLSIEAAEQSRDPALEPAVEKLTQDRSLQVRDRASKALHQWSSPGTSPSARALQRFDLRVPHPGLARMGHPYHPRPDGVA